MMRNKILFFITMAWFLVTAGYAQTGGDILKSVYGKLQKAKDYTVQANIKLDMPFIRMLPVNVKIYFKQKDKVKVESKSIAIVPKQGFNQISAILGDNKSFVTLIQGEEKVGTILAKIVNVIPTSDTSDIILGKLWIDQEHSLVLKSMLTTKSNGTITTEYFYGSQIDFGLPDKMIFSVDVKKFRIPKSVLVDTNKSDSGKTDKGKEGKKGKIYIVLNGYQINKGIPDSIFNPN